MSQLFVTIEDLVIAYRKAKYDAFYETGHLTLMDFANYEHNLFDNLKILLQRINEYDLDWFRRDDFIGEHLFSLKKIELEKKQKSTSFQYYSDSERNWNSINIKSIDFRILGKHSVHFHVLSSLWLEKVGYKLEENVSKNGYGCRLRSNFKGYFDEYKKEEYLRGKFGHFKSYLPAYQAWQRNGIGEIRNALKANKKVIAVTTDLKKFYHRIEPSFLVNTEFLDYLNISLDADEFLLTNILISAIKSWSSNVFSDTVVPKEFKYNGHIGIPMGLGASKTIANLLLIHLDRNIEQEIKPIYYGRYIDDIFLVLEDGGNINNSDDFWIYLKRRIDTLYLSLGEDHVSSSIEYEPGGHILKTPYSPDSLIEFNLCKEKYFFLEGSSGESFISVLEKSLDENSSEWNLPPDIENDVNAFAEEVTKATSDNEEAVNGLRKSDGLSIQRLNFILYLKRLELTVKYFPEENWRDKVYSFFDLCLEHTVTPENIATYSKYFPRVVSLAIKVKNIDFIERILGKISNSFKKLSSCVTVNQEVLKRSKNYIESLIEEAIFYTADPENDQWINGISIIKRDFETKSQIIELIKRLIVSDLHKKPFKDYFLYPDTKIPDYFKAHQFSSSNGRILKSVNLSEFEYFKKFSNSVIRITYLSKAKSNFRPFAFYFFTRPFTLFDLSITFPHWVDQYDDFKNFCSFFKIYLHIEKGCSPGLDIPENIKTICISTYESELNRTIAFTSLETKNVSWIAVVQQHPIEPDGTRVQRLFKLIENIIRSSKEKIHYVLFPELSIPKEFLSYISYLFLRHKISIIAGVEYEDISKHWANPPLSISRFVTNKLFFILTTKGNSGPSHIVLQQEKAIPAQGEERELFNVGGAMLRPVSTYKYLINHSGFWFAGLICNDFLDINNRAVFRGLIDALVVVEWNKDIETYNALVESSANDLHTFIMQVNNRLYGDTRLRAPYKESYERDVVRVRGGELDYFVIATLKVKELRAFQRHFRSPATPFKPVPTGFIMSPERKNKGI